MALSAFRRRSTYGDKFSPPQCTACEIQLDSGANFYTSPYLFNVGVHLCSKPSKLIFSRLSWDFESIFYNTLMIPGTYEHGFILVVDQVSQPPLTTLRRKHGGTKLLVLFDKHISRNMETLFFIYHISLSLYIKIIPGIYIYE